MVAVPPDMTVGPQYGLAVMTAVRLEAMLLALTILTPSGQTILAANGFSPVTLPDGRWPDAGRSTTTPCNT
jgi:molybdate transport system substrate-binding protein